MAQRVQESIEVQAPLQDVYGYWSNFQNFPRFMENIEEVRMTGEDTSHWKVKGPLGTSVEFDAKTTQMNPEQGVGWNTVDGQVMTSGEIRFQEVQPDRTRVEVTMNYADPPGGKAGEASRQYSLRSREEHPPGPRKLRRNRRTGRVGRF